MITNGILLNRVIPAAYLAKGFRFDSVRLSFPFPYASNRLYIYKVVARYGMGNARTTSNYHIE